MEKKKKIFVNGTFDLLHVGHLQLLNHARGLGDFLTVAIDNDERVAEKKGLDRPILPAKERLFHLMNLRAVDEGFIFDSDEALELVISKVKPDIMVVGSDWRGKEIVGSNYAGEVQFFDRLPEWSTTDVIQRIINR
jgi:D-beta-D-heptose 7-phosphate kinase/D-beta-D-heptose 1-phosphate adenosyltransferase